ncbi:MAG: YbhB/YbcL family Raf kinase inhibitor-like protein [bacterium]|nr:YbhB/YbcL family Raf kinase inhibitor-like protein [bacterium]
MDLYSRAFENNGLIPKKYTCDGEDISPPLKWSNPPANTKSFALIADDPDAPIGTWVHWVIYNIPADKTELPEGLAKKYKLEDGTIQGINDFGKYGYGGPCPPSGTHRYFFKLYALDTILPEKQNLRKNDLLEMIKGHILAEAQLIGKYFR